MNIFFQDMRYALRKLAKTPAFTTVAVLTLALGIGANSAIFTLIDGVLLKKLPVDNPNSLVRIGDWNPCCVWSGTQNNHNDQGDYAMFSLKDYQYLKANVPEFQSLSAMQAAISSGGVTARKADSNALPESATPEFVSGNYFQTFNVKPMLGRTLVESDDASGAASVAVLGYNTWQKMYASNQNVIGTTVFLNTHPATIVGVLPPSFYGDRLTSNSVDYYIPLSSEKIIGSNLSSQDVFWLYLMGRTKANVSLPTLQSKISGLIRQSFVNYAAFQDADGRQALAKAHVVLTPAATGVDSLQKEAKSTLALLEGIAAIVLLIACANIANLVLVRSMARRAEISVRVAVGAARRRVMLQMLTESVVLSLIGGIAGLGVAYSMTRVMLSVMFPDSISPISATPSAAVLALSFLISLATGIIFGLAPAWISSKSDPADALRGINRSTGSHTSWLQRSLVVFQAALSLVLLIGAGLLVKSFDKLLHQDLGIQTQNRYVIHFSPRNAGYKPEQLESFYAQLKQNLLSLPAVQSASVATYTPVEGDTWGDIVFIQGHPKPGPHDSIGVSWDRIDSDFFKTLQVPVLRGRSITESDTASTPNVAVVNQAFVKQFFKHGENPIGQHFGTQDMHNAADREIVGVVRDIRFQNPRVEASPIYFVPMLQVSKTETVEERKGEELARYAGSIILLTRGDSTNLEAHVRETIARINPNLTVSSFTSYSEQISSQVGKLKMLERLLSCFAGLSLLLASIGLYGVSSYGVEQRTQEIGVRMALGADRRSVVAMIFRSALLQTAIGLCIGVPIAIVTARVMSAEMYQVNSFDPSIVAAAIVVLACAAGVAAWIPAYRAASINPLNALRTE